MNNVISINPCGDKDHHAYKEDMLSYEQHMNNPYVIFYTQSICASTDFYMNFASDNHVVSYGNST